MVDKMVQITQLLKLSIDLYKNQARFFKNLNSILLVYSSPFDPRWSHSKTLIIENYLPLVYLRRTWYVQDFSCTTKTAGLWIFYRTGLWSTKSHVTYRMFFWPTEGNGPSLFFRWVDSQWLLEYFWSSRA